MTPTLELRTQGATRRYDAGDFPLTIGGPDADIEIPGRPDSNPIAHLGIAENEVFLQPADGGETVFCNGGPVTTSQWLRHGDTLRVAEAEMLFSSDGGEAILQVRRLETDDGTEPPSVVIMAAPAQGRAAGEGRQRIQPVEFTPVPLQAGRRRSRSPRRATVAWWIAMALLAMAAWYLFSARPVELRVEPTPELLRVEGGLLRLRIGGRYLLRPGTYTVVAESPGYRQLERPIEVTTASSQVFEFELERLPGLLDLELSVEAAATLWVDGEQQEVFPLEPLELTPGEHRLLIQAEGYRDYATEVAIEGGGTTQTLEVALQPLWATVTLSSQPAAAEVRIDGELVGRTPLTTEVLEGTRGLEIGLAGFKPHRSRFEVKAEETIELPTVRLLPNDGTLTLSSEPAGATVTVDGEYRGQTPLEVTMAPGRQYEVSLSKLGYETYTVELTVASGERRPEAIALVERLGDIEIITRPAGAELYVNGEPRGSANQTLRLQAIPQQIEIGKQGFVSYSQTVTPRPGVSQALEVDLVTQQEARAAKIPPVIQGPQGQELRLIEPGRFRVGAPRREPGRRANETLREIELTRSFYLATREVSNKEFEASFGPSGPGESRERSPPSGERQLGGCSPVLQLAQREGFARAGLCVPQRCPAGRRSAEQRISSTHRGGMGVGGAVRRRCRLEVPLGRIAARGRRVGQLCRSIGTGKSGGDPARLWRWVSGHRPGRRLRAQCRGLEEHGWQRRRVDPRLLCHRAQQFRTAGS